jgi:hypothetical protein
MRRGLIKSSLNNIKFCLFGPEMSLLKIVNKRGLNGTEGTTDGIVQTISSVWAMKQRGTH